MYSCAKIKECRFSGVTSCGRVWRKVPESDARSVLAPDSPPVWGLHQIAFHGASACTGQSTGLGSASDRFSRGVSLHRTVHWNGSASDRFSRGRQLAPDSPLDWGLHQIAFHGASLSWTCAVCVWQVSECRHWTLAVTTSIAWCVTSWLVTTGRCDRPSTAPSRSTSPSGQPWRRSLTWWVDCRPHTSLWRREGSGVARSLWRGEYCGMWNVEISLCLGEYYETGKYHSVMVSTMECGNITLSWWVLWNVEISLCRGEYYGMWKYHSVVVSTMECGNITLSYYGMRKYHWRGEHYGIWKYHCRGEYSEMDMLQ